MSHTCDFRVGFQGLNWQGSRWRTHVSGGWQQPLKGTLLERPQECPAGTLGTCQSAVLWRNAGRSPCLHTAPLQLLTLDRKFLPVLITHLGEQIWGPGVHVCVRVTHTRPRALFPVLPIEGLQLTAAPATLKTACCSQSSPRSCCRGRT